MERIHAPELDGAAWLNVARPLTLRELRGNVVVLDFWTYCCINCMHVLPVLRAVEERFRNQPLVVIGVHSAKFDEEKAPARIAEAIARYQIEHPVVVDDELRIWQRYAIRSWPTLVILRPDATVAAVAPGEPDAEMLTSFLARLLDEARADGTLARSPFALPTRRETVGGALRFPGKVSVAKDGRVAIADSGHHRVLVCAPDGEVVTCAGSGLRGLRDGALADAAFDDPQGLAWLGDDLLVCDVRNHALRRIAGGQVSTVAGTGELGGRMPAAPAPAREVALRSPWDVAVADEHTVYVAMAGAHQIWTFDPSTDMIARFAGSGAEALVDGPLAEAAFAQPSWLWLDGRRMWIADSETSSVRYIDLDRRCVVTVVGHGLFEFGDVDGPHARARLQHDLGVCGRDGEVLIADTYNGKLKRLDARELRTAISGLSEPGGLCVAPDGRVSVADTNAHRVVVLDRALSTVTPFPLRGAPEPQEGALCLRAPIGGGEAAGWFTAQLTLADGDALGPGPAVLALTLIAPPARELAAGSPLRLSLEVSRRPDLLVLPDEHRAEAAGGARFTVEVPARVTTLPEDGPVESEVVAVIDYVSCQDTVCTPGRAHVRIPVRLASGGGARLAFEAQLGQY